MIEVAAEVVRMPRYAPRGGRAAGGSEAEVSSMASKDIHEFTDGNFVTEVINSDIPGLVDFWAEWCQPCRMLTPTMVELADEYKGKVKIGKLDTDSNRDVSIKYGISAIPTIILFQDGEVKKKFVGLTPKDQFAAALDEVGG